MGQFPLSFGRQNISKPWHSSDTQVLEAWPPLWLSTGMGLSSAEMESTSSTVSARRRGLLRLSRGLVRMEGIQRSPHCWRSSCHRTELCDSRLTPEQKGAAWGLNWGLVKRDADSEADAYYGGAYTGYGYGGLGYGYGGL